MVKITSLFVKQTTLSQTHNNGSLNFDHYCHSQFKINN